MVLTKSIELIFLIIFISITLNRAYGLNKDLMNEELCENLCYNINDSHNELADFLDCDCSNFFDKKSK